MENKILCTCKICGATAYMYTKKRHVPEKDKIFECNKCVAEKWQKEARVLKTKQAILF